MKKRDWFLIALAVGSLVCILMLPGLSVRMQERKLLRETRTADADLMAFAQEENTTLLERMNIMVSPGSAYTGLDVKEVGNRFGEPQLLTERCMEELLTLFPDAYRMEQLIRGTEVGFSCYVEPFTKQTMVVALCEFELDDAILSVGLDVTTKKIISLSLEGWNKNTGNSSKEKEPVYANPAYATVVKDLQIDQEKEQWFRHWAEYWGVDCDSFRSNESGSLCYARLEDPVDPDYGILYELSFLREFTSLRPVHSEQVEEAE